MKKLLTALVLTVATSALANDPATHDAKATKAAKVSKQTKQTAEATTDEQTGAPPVAKKEAGATQGIHEGSTEPHSAKNAQAAPAGMANDPIHRDSHHTAEATKDEKTSPPPVAKKETAMGGAGTTTAPAPVLTEKQHKRAEQTKKTSDSTTDEQTGAPPVANKEKPLAPNDQTNNVKNKNEAMGETPKTK